MKHANSNKDSVEFDRRGAVREPATRNAKHRRKRGQLPPQREHNRGELEKKGGNMRTPVPREAICPTETLRTPERSAPENSEKPHRQKGNGLQYAGLAQKRVFEPKTQGVRWRKCARRRHGRQRNENSWRRNAENGKDWSRRSGGGAGRKKRKRGREKKAKASRKQGSRNSPVTFAEGGSSARLPAVPGVRRGGRSECAINT